MNEDISVNLIELYESLSLMFEEFGEKTMREGLYTMAREKNIRCYPGNEFYDTLRWELFDSGSVSERLVFLTGASRAYLRRVMSRLSSLGDGKKFRDGFTEKVLKHLPGVSVLSWDAGSEPALADRVKVADSIVPFSAGRPSRWLLLKVDGVAYGNRLFVPIGPNSGEYITKAKNLQTWWMRHDKDNTETTVADIGYTFQMMYLVSLIRETADNRRCQSLDEYLDAETDALVESHMADGIHRIPQRRTATFGREGELVPYERLLSSKGITYSFSREDECTAEEVRTYKEKALLVWMRNGDRDRLLEQVYSGTAKIEGVSTFYIWRPNDIPEMFARCFRKYSDLRDNERYNEALRKEHATWFMDLKDMPQKYRSAADKSMFRRYFRKIEYDPDVLLVNDDAGFTYIRPDGTTMELPLYGDFKNIADMLGWRFMDVALRFRKLGNHHASGLYGDFAKTVCIDYRTPGSFAHELFHAYDYQNGMLSQSAGFMEVRSLYETLLKKAVKKGGIKLKGKYDMHYYLTGTEVFARCGEIYLTCCCGVANACIQPSDTLGFAYPKEEAFVAKIKVYFDGVFGRRSAAEDISA